jgi:peptide/nickel transport system substrate-binding protein
MEPLQNMYETLIAYEKNSSSEFLPVLATLVPSLENGLISTDGLSYTFPIRSGIKFHHGGELTPEDVEYSFERGMVLDPAGGPVWMILSSILGVGSTRGDDGIKVTFDQIDKAVEVEGNNVVFHLSKASPWFLQIMPLTWCSIVDKSWVIEQGGWPGTEESWKKFNNLKKEESALFDKSNGTGPFSFDRWDQGNQIVLIRNDDYWRPPAKVQKVVRKVVPEWSTRMLLFKTGDADIVDVQRQFLSQVKAYDGIRVIDNLPELNIITMFLNQHIEPKGNQYIGSGKLDGNGIPPDFFSRLDIRKAFNHAFDWGVYIRDAFDGAAIQSKGPIPEAVPYFNPEQATYKHDLEKAGELLKNAYDGQLWENGFQFKFPYISGVAEYQTSIDILRRNLSALNSRFKIEPVALPAPKLYEAWKSKWMPIRVGYWRSDYPDPDNNVFGLLHSDGYYSSSQGFTKYNALIEEGARTVDPTKRQKIYFELQQMAYEDAVDIFLVQTTGWFVSREWLKGWYRHSPLWARNVYFYSIWKE